MRAPKHKQAPKVAISGEQIIRIIARMEREGRRDLAVLFRLAAMSGARRGELAALRWDNIDFSRGQITISRALSAAERQGHSPRVMMEVYAHALPERDRAAREALGKALE